MTPEHYNYKTKPIDVIKEWKLNFNLGNVLKYIVRHNQKNGIEDLRKALT